MREEINKLAKSKVVAVIRTNTPEKAIETIKAAIKGGFKFVEITFTIPNVEKVLEKINNLFSKDDVIFGGGTILNINDYKICKSYNLKFVVGPNLNLEIAKKTKEDGVLYIPGVMTVNEIIEATNNGVEIVKLFPASHFKPTIIKDFIGPLPNIKIMPSGGIDLENIDEWFKAGAFACSVGGKLVKYVEDNNFESAVDYSKKIVGVVK